MKILFVVVCLWIFWSTQQGQPWIYGGSFRTEQRCYHDGEVRVKPSPLKSPIKTICLPVGLHPNDTGLFGDESK